MGTFYVRWGDMMVLRGIETDEEFAPEDLMTALGRLELQSLEYAKEYAKHGDVLPVEG